MKKFLLLLNLLPASLLWAAAPITDRSVAAERAESAQFRAEAAWRDYEHAQRETAEAQQIFNTADRDYQEANKLAVARAQALAEARSTLEARQAEEKSAQTAWDDARKLLDNLWSEHARPR